jgi:predicted MarR family transcription regulator
MKSPSPRGALLAPLPQQAEPMRNQQVACHLATDFCATSLTRLELAVMRIQEAYSNWVTELHKHAGGPPLSFQDVALLHCVRLRGGTPSLGEMLIFQHRHDLSSLQYGFKKLESVGCLRRVRGANRRETCYAMTEFGLKITDRYAELRSRMLVQLCADVVGLDDAMGQAAEVLERIIGKYDQATQSVLNDHILGRENPYSHAPGAQSAKP